MRCKIDESGHRAKRGKIIKSVWMEEKLADGTLFKLNRRVREIPHKYDGTVKHVSEQTLLMPVIGPEMQAEIDASRHSVLETSIDWICTVCKTSDHVQKDKDSMGGHSCTRCWGYCPT